MTGDDGSFRFLGTPLGRRTLYYALPGARSRWGKASTFDVTGDRTDLGVLSLSIARLNVTVSAGGRTDALSGMRVSLQEFDPNWLWGEQVGKTLPRNGPTDPFVIEHVPPGQYEVITYAENIPSVRQVVEVKPGQRELSVALQIPQGSASISGTVDHDMCGAGGCRPLSLWTKDRAFMAYLMPDGAGRFKLENLPAGEYGITAKSARDAKPILRISLKEGESRTLDLNEATCSVGQETAGLAVVRVVTDQGIPLPGARLNLEGKDGRLDPSREVMGDQHFIGSPGQYVLHAAFPGYKSKTERVSLKISRGEGLQDADVIVPVTLEPAE
jgi:hypothetical protein